MNEETVKLWCIKADNDLKTGKDELLTESPATDTVCFHMQQCVEKYLKAFLVFHGKEIDKTHNIALLLQQCIGIDSSFEELKSIDTNTLTVYAVDSRYPDDFYMPTFSESQKAVAITEEVRKFVLTKIEIKT
jgi:HEPN domain-containing protein